MSGVFVSTSAGNAGPLERTVTNCAPWLLTVAASTMGRRVVSRIQLVNGIVAMLKKARPEWLPAAIKSALMTTADVTHPDGTPIVDETTGRPNCFAMGAGLVNPTRALDPGLVYDLAPADYIPYVCGLGYEENFVKDIIAQPMMNVSCATAGKVEGKDLNYPSIMVTLTPAVPEVVVRRTVTNIGDPLSVYTAEVVTPKGVAVEVVPNVLGFGVMLRRSDFTVKLTRGADAAANGGTAEGSLRWVSRNGKYSVRSPIAILFDPLPN